MTEDETSLQGESLFKAAYIKSNFFRVIHVDGVFGGMTPRGLLHLDVWSERSPIPKEATYELKDGRLGDEVKERRVSLDAVVREVEVGMVMDIGLAKSLVELLQKQITMAEALMSEVKSEKG